jgi:HlyD family secretion protein
VVTTEKAVVKTITHLVTATGKVQPEVEVKISPEVAGELIEIPVIEGQAVKKGDLLVRIKPDFYQAQLEQQEAALASAKAASVLSQARLNKAEQDYKQAQELYAKQLVSDADFTSNAKTNLDVAQADFDSSLAQIRRTEGFSARPAIRWPRPPSIRRWTAASAPSPARWASAWSAPAPSRAPRSCASPT